MAGGKPIYPTSRFHEANASFSAALWQTGTTLNHNYLNFLKVRF